MDEKTVAFQRIIKSLLSEIEQVTNRNRSPNTTEMVCVFDDERGHYLLLNIGWSGDHRGEGRTIYLRLHNGKVWLEDDCTDLDIGGRLLEAGIPKTDIVLGFQPPNLRKFTEFAVA